MLPNYIGLLQGRRRSTEGTQLVRGCLGSPHLSTHMIGSYHFKRRGIMGASLVRLTAMLISLLSATAHATEIYAPGRATVHHHNRWYFGRIGPQSCFLMPDVIVAVNARGPYCSSPRGVSHVWPVAHHGPYWPSYGYYVPYYGYYRPWGWSDVGAPWGW
jgi:hypothetical protein